MSNRMERLKELISQREGLESEADMITQALTSPGPNGEPPAGLKDPLVDSEGYPRGDIDLYDVRRKRNRLAVINTDYKQLMKAIDKEVQSLYSINEEEKITPPVLPVARVETMTGPPDAKVNQVTTSIPSRSFAIPFAIVDEILPNSPAQLAGLVDGDELVRFDSVDGKVQNPLSQIPQIVTNNANHPILLVVQRGGEEINISLTPKSWAGRGLLGCHLTPIG
jgi:26S proteasome regulatory subunit N4